MTALVLIFVGGLIESFELYWKNEIANKNSANNKYGNIFRTCLHRLEDIPSTRHSDNNMDGTAVP